MKPRFWPQGLLLCGLAVLLTGCVWTRLLAFKQQLADFDRYVQVEDRDGLTLHLTKPVLYAKDILFLMELEPTRRLTNGAAQSWFWTFRKVPGTNAPAESGDFDLTFSTQFVSNQLTGFTLNERFLASIPKPLLLGVLRSVGGADIDAKRRTATMRWAGQSPDSERQTLRHAAVTQLLGQPYSATTTNETTTSLYRYQLDSPSRPPTNAALQARVRFTFHDPTDKLQRVQAAYGSFKFSYHANSNAPAPP